MEKKRTSLAIYALCAILILVFGVFIGFGLVSFSFVGPSEVTTTEFTPVRYGDYVTILLTATTAVLAVLTVFIALIAIVGYQVIKTSAINEARRTVDALFDEDGDGLQQLLRRLGSDKDFQNKVTSALGSAALKGIYLENGQLRSSKSAEKDEQFSDD